jgi:hypothetical protein
MSQKLFELIKGMTGHLCTEADLDDIIQPVITCDGCGYQTPFWNTIDHWTLAKGKEYCRKCQKLNLDV